MRYDIYIVRGSEIHQAIEESAKEIQAELDGRRGWFARFLIRLGILASDNESARFEAIDRDLKRKEL